MAAGDDSDLPTAHLRCGSDIFRALRDAGFTGDLVEHSYPYAHGPVQDGAAALPGRARFILGRAAWDALASADPRDLAALAATGTPALLATLECLESPPDPALCREPGEGPRRPWTDRFSATPFGRRLLAGQADWMETAPPVRWVGGVAVGGGGPDGRGLPAFRWDAASGNVVTVGT